MKVINSIYNWFLKPYPFFFSITNNLKISFGFGFSVFLFLYLFQPFGMSENIEINNFSIFYFTLGFGLITLAVLLLNLFIFPLLFSSFFNPNKWIIGRVVLFLLVTIIMISFFNWYFNSWYFILKSQTPNAINIEGLVYFLMYTILVAILPSLVFVYFVERNRTKKHILVADAILKNKNNFINTNDTILDDRQVLITAENNKDELLISILDLIYISSQGNYASIFCLLDGKIKEHLIRASLSEIESQLADNKHIIRCHKSYLVNTNQVSKINGNARGYLLKVNYVDFLIPVSRNFPKESLYTLVH